MEFSGHMPDPAGVDDPLLVLLEALKLKLLSQDFCQHCRPLLVNCLDNLFKGKYDGIPLPSCNNSESGTDICSGTSSSFSLSEKTLESVGKSVDVSLRNGNCSESSVDICSMNSSSLYSLDNNLASAGEIENNSENGTDICSGTSSSFSSSEKTLESVGKSVDASLLNGNCSESSVDIYSMNSSSLYSQDNNLASAGEIDGVSLPTSNSSQSSEDICSENPSCSLEELAKSLESISSVNLQEQVTDSSHVSFNHLGSEVPLDDELEVLAVVDNGVLSDDPVMKKDSESLSSVDPQEKVADSSHVSVNSPEPSFDHLRSEVALDDELNEVSAVVEKGVSDDTVMPKGSSLFPEQIEQIRLSQVGRKKEFIHIERIHGKATNILQGLELHTQVFNAVEQKEIVDYVYSLQHMGQKGQLKGRTYSEPKKWMHRKGRVTMQFGCCYNYAADRNGNPPGIIRGAEVDALPPLFKTMIKRMVQWRVLPTTCVPNSCVVNIYEEGDSIPPHMDLHNFLRPFCTVSLLSECNMLFGSHLKVVHAGKFAGSVSIPLPVGSVLIVSSHSADLAKHCIPGVPAKRISITFRRMDDSKLPFTFLPDPELQGLKPLIIASSAMSPVQQVWHLPLAHCGSQLSSEESEAVGETNTSPFNLGEDDFPPLGSSKPKNKPRNNENQSKPLI
ncbi:hypothetical protein HHK36_008981 [Tetracentron sinense]|uniref:Fe2OG dioxygenase domain-containing protein n=1 Tax=Tetracentron sinense TaxID=13715 RepID=A0A835DHZ8_TETSI|nr:hypothetical protein HHK36_008981 [Tetracentron sinense]